MDQVNQDLDLYNKWLYYNKLKINIDKTKYILFKQKNKKIGGNLNIKIDNQELEKVFAVKYLGLIIDESISWEKHLHRITDKILAMIPVIYKCRTYLNDKTKYLIYNTFFLTHFRYLIPIWGTCYTTSFEKMQILQNKILKIIFNYNILTSTDQLYKELKVPKLKALLQLEQCKLIHKILNADHKTNTHFTYTNEIHDYCTRTRNNLYLEPSRTDKSLYSPVHCAIKTYNNLPNNLRSIQNYKHFLKILKSNLKH